MLQELIDAADRLCRNLEVASECEKKFSIDMCIALETYSDKVYTMLQDIKELKELYGNERDCAY